MLEKMCYNKDILGMVPSIWKGGSFWMDSNCKNLEGGRKYAKINENYEEIR